MLRVVNAFSEQGVQIVDDDSGRYHVSGHANRPDLELMHGLVDPVMVIPMHGEHRHLRAHADLVRANGRKSAIAVNGTMLELTPEGPKVAEYIEAGRTYLDGKVLIGALDGVVRGRMRMALNGHVMVTLILDEDDAPLGEPWVETMGLPETGVSRVALVDVVEEDLSQFLHRASRKTLRDEEGLEKELSRIARNSCNTEIGKKPEVTVVVSRLG